MAEIKVGDRVRVIRNTCGAHKPYDWTIWLVPGDVVTVAEVWPTHIHYAMQIIDHRSSMNFIRKQDVERVADDDPAVPLTTEEPQARPTPVEPFAKACPIPVEPPAGTRDNETNVERVPNGEAVTPLKAGTTHDLPLLLGILVGVPTALLVGWGVSIYPSVFRVLNMTVYEARERIMNMQVAEFLTHPVVQQAMAQSVALLCYSLPAGVALLGIGSIRRGLHKGRERRQALLEKSDQMEDRRHRMEYERVVGHEKERERRQEVESRIAEANRRSRQEDEKSSAVKQAELIASIVREAIQPIVITPRPVSPDILARSEPTNSPKTRKNYDRHYRVTANPLRVMRPEYNGGVERPFEIGEVFVAVAEDEQYLYFSTSSKQGGFGAFPKINCTILTSIV